MKMSGERVIPAPQARVWDALNDPDVLRQSVPGCQEMVKRSPTEFSSRVQAKVGPVKANFAGDVSLSDLDPPHSYRISGQGSGGAAGFAQGGADVRLEDMGGGQTKLVYDVDAKVGGKLAQIGSRLIDSTARRMADDFFDRFAEIVANGESRPAPKPEFPSSVEPAEAPAEAAPMPTEAATAKAATAKKAPAKKSAARKTPAKKTAARKPVARTTAAKPKEPETPPEFASEPAPPPSLSPAAAVAGSASPRRDEPPQAAPQQQNVPGNMSGNNIWWIVGAGIAALLVILVLANL